MGEAKGMGEVKGSLFGGTPDFKGHLYQILLSVRCHCGAVP